MSTYPFPKIDLHLHLDGSMLPETAWELAHEQGVKLPAEDLESFRRFIVVSADCRSVNEYLKRFDMPLALMQDKDSIARGDQRAHMSPGRSGTCLCRDTLCASASS